MGYAKICQTVLEEMLIEDAEVLLSSIDVHSPLFSGVWRRVPGQLTRSRVVSMSEQYWKRRSRRSSKRGEDGAWWQRNKR